MLKGVHVILSILMLKVSKCYVNHPVVVVVVSTYRLVPGCYVSATFGFAFDQMEVWSVECGVRLFNTERVH